MGSLSDGVRKHLEAEGVPERQVAVVVDRAERLEAAVQHLGDKHGYGALMAATSMTWGDFLDEKGLDGSQFVIGPCKALTVPCECERKEGTGCDWCAGTGWLTKKVATLQATERE